MSAVALQVEAMRNLALDQLQALLASAGPTIVIGGKETPWGPMLEPLQEAIDWCDRKLAEYDPYEVRTRGGS